MSIEAKPGERIAGHREITISDWKPHSKNTLVGFFSATFPSGMVLHNLMLHQKGEARWIGVPAREWLNQEGQKQFTPLVEFRDRYSADRFRDQVLDALDKHLAERRQ
jgi:hypothetical protein